MAFETNTFENLQILEINESKVYIKDHFYKNPHEVLNILTSTPPNMWKSWDSPSYNGTYFLDSRHDFYHQDMLAVNDQIEDLCGQKVAQRGQVITNCIKFYDLDFNDYKDNYWSPHEDLGYTALIYLNEFDCNGTNFYNRIASDIWEGPEHYDPWRSKNKFELIYTVKSKFNRMVLFDGEKLTHGMAINDSTFFYITRMNQAIFLTG